MAFGTRRMEVYRSGTRKLRCPPPGTRRTEFILYIYIFIYTVLVYILVVQKNKQTLAVRKCVAILLCPCGRAVCGGDCARTASRSRGCVQTARSRHRVGMPTIMAVSCDPIRCPRGPPSLSCSLADGFSDVHLLLDLLARSP